MKQHITHDRMIEFNEEIYRKHLAKYAYNHDWTASQITEAFNWAKGAWEQLSHEEFDNRFSDKTSKPSMGTSKEASSDDKKFVDYVNNVINDMTSASMPKTELVRGMFVAFICTLRDTLRE